MTWLTNCPKAASKLNAADRAYNKAHAAALHLSLEQKVEAYRKAKADRVAAYAKVVKS
jgi:hypothetical protein